jgi:uncharacterized RDD family membrane protein YckC
VTSQQPGTGQSVTGLGQADQDGPGTDPDMRQASPGDDPGAPGAGQAVTWPSPYLSEGHGVPEAYPAPPQPGQPGYGAPGTGFPSGPGYRSPAQPASTERGYGRQRARAMAPRDPALAVGWERFAACSLDWLLIFVAASLPLLSPLLRIWHQLENVALHSQTLGQSAAQAAMYNILLAPGTTRTIIAFELLTLGIALAYFWVLPAAWGTTMGKRVLGLRVVTAADRSSIGIRAAGLRAAAFLAGPALFLLLPTYISWLGLLMWFTDGMAMAVDPRRQSLHDRAAGSAVICLRRAR